MPLTNILSKTSQHCRSWISSSWLLDTIDSDILCSTHDTTYEPQHLLFCRKLTPDPMRIFFLVFKNTLSHKPRKVCFSLLQEKGQKTLKEPNSCLETKIAARNRIRSNTENLEHVNVFRRRLNFQAMSNKTDPKRTFMIPLKSSPLMAPSFL